MYNEMIKREKINEKEATNGNNHLKKEKLDNDK